MDVRFDAFQIGDDRQSGPAGHAQVHDRQIGRIAAEYFNAFIAIPGDLDSKSALLKGFRQAVAENVAIVDEQNALGRNLFAIHQVCPGKTRCGGFDGQVSKTGNPSIPIEGKRSGPLPFSQAILG